MVTATLLIGLLAVAAATDVSRHKIYNWTTYPGILVAWAWNAAGDLSAAASPPSGPALEQLGWITLWQSFLGFLLCGVVLLICYVVFAGGISGGDVKMIAMMGALLGPERGIVAMLWTFVLGFCLAICVLIWRVGPLSLVGRLLRMAFGMLRLGIMPPLTPEERAQLKPPLSLAPAALAAAVLIQFPYFGGYPTI